MNYFPLSHNEAEVRQFRSLSASMCLAQSLVIGYAFATATTTRNDSALGRHRSVKKRTGGRGTKGLK